MASLRESLEIERQLQKDGLAPRGTLHLHNVRARFNLDQDLGLEPGHLHTYDLDDETRDRLIAHTRQDASLAVYAAHAAERLGIVNRRMMFVVIAMLCAVFWRIW